MLRFSLFVITFLYCTSLSFARQYRDTLKTVAGDKIIVTYDLKYTNDKATIQFRNVKTILCEENLRKYRKEEIDLVFFDRTGVYENITFSNMIPAAFMVPSELQYQSSERGYFFISESPSINFSILSNRSSLLKIPLYLVYSSGKSKFKLISRCSYLEITLKGAMSNSINPVTKAYSQITQNIEHMVPDSGNDEQMEVANSINTVLTLLAAQTRLPFSDGLQYEITKLRLLQDQVKERALAYKIKDVLTECEVKKSELESAAAAQVKIEQEKAEEQARIEREQALEKEAAIAEEQKVQEEKQRKRTIWMIVGGILLSVIFAVGNQIMQHFSRLRSQKSMFEMQQDMTRRAENEARRHAQNMARRQTDRAMNKVKQSGRDIINNTKSKSPNTIKQPGVSKGSRKISI